MRGKSGFRVGEEAGSRERQRERISLKRSTRHSQVIHFRSDTIFVRNREDLQHFPFELNR